MKWSNYKHVLLSKRKTPGSWGGASGSNTPDCLGACDSAFESFERLSPEHKKIEQCMFGCWRNFHNFPGTHNLIFPSIWYVSNQTLYETLQKRLNERPMGCHAGRCELISKTRVFHQPPQSHHEARRHTLKSAVTSFLNRLTHAHNKEMFFRSLSCIIF